MIAYRYTMLFDLNTVPAVRLTNIGGRVAGWSESFWNPSNSNPTQAQWNNLMANRSVLLGATGSIIGWKLANFNIIGNRASAAGTRVFNVNLPGLAGNPTDIPQMGVQCLGLTGAGVNRTNFWIRGVPDGEVVNGDIQFDANYAVAMSNYLAAVRGGWGFVGRDLSQPLVGVVSWVPGTHTLTLTGAVGGLLPGGYIRFHRCNDDSGKPVKGSFQVTAVATNVLTLQTGPVNPISTPNGTIRLDLLNLFPYSSCTYLRAGPKKVGRPFFLYHGRRTKRR